MKETMISQDGPAVTLRGVTYVPIRFNRILSKEAFKELASLVLHGHQCVFSKPIKRWFCPEGNLLSLTRQADSFAEGLPEEEDLGDELAKLVGE